METKYEVTITAIGNLARTFLRLPLPEEKMREPELNTPDRRKQA